MSLHVKVLILGRAIAGKPTETTLILNELPRPGQLLSVGADRSIVVENVSTTNTSGYHAIIAGPLART